MEGVRNGLKIMMTVFFIIWIASVLSACATLAGVKRYQDKDMTIDFVTGLDFGISANGVDTVKNERGIEPAGNDGVRLQEAKN